MTSTIGPSGTTGPLIHVGRQPIYDRTGDVVAYELLFRDSVGALDASRRSAQATSRVIVSAFTEFGLDQLAGSKACFINVTREFLVGDLPVPFDSNQAVLEIIETVEVDDAVVAGVTDLISRGFTIALDDFVPGTGAERLLELASYVKIDMLDAEPDDVAAIVRMCGNYPQAQLIAERLETEEQLQLAFELGFHLFQGHVLGRPHVVSTVGLSPARISRLQLITALSADDVDFDDVVGLITRDPAISYRLLQATNAAASGLTARVSSVHEAAVLLGLHTVRQWVTLMLFSDLAEATEEQLISTMTRARVCQVLAERLNLPGDSAFTVGLLSGIAELIAEPTSALASNLPLADNVKTALSHGGGDLGRVLTAVRQYERGDMAGIGELLEPDELVKTYLSALGWSTRIFTSTSMAVAASHPTTVPDTA